MTGGAFTARARSFVESGAACCVDKPLDRGQLGAAIELTLRRAR